MFVAIFVLFAVYSCVIPNPVTAEVNYCSICTDHTLCLFPFDAPSGICALTYKRAARLNASDIQFIVNKHNELRARVATGQETRGNPGPQPPASNMKILKWDSELALIAQRCADRCILLHDRCRNVARHGQIMYVAQNIYRTPSNSIPLTQTLENAIDAWYNEVPQFDGNNISPFTFSSGTSSYSQLLWAETSSVGCGRSNWFDRTLGNTSIIVCNYGPRGNIIGNPAYQIGPAGSACLSGVSSASPSLCN